MLVCSLIAGSAGSSSAQPTTWTAEIRYDLTDKNGMGWVTSVGTTAATLTFTDKASSLHVVGTQRRTDAQLKSQNDVKTKSWEIKQDATYPLLDVVRKINRAITFRFDDGKTAISGRCEPTKVSGLSRSDLYECSFSGFRWHEVVALPELHHSLVFAASPPRVLNAMSGTTKQGFGTRVVSEVTAK